MQRSITTIDGKRYLRTVNGVDTKTATLYLHELKDYQPQANGFVAELADDILQVVHTRPELWDQGSWRHAFWADPIVESELWAEVAAMRGVELSKNEPACGTTMCIAGWAGELTGADWMLDADALGKISGNEETILVTKDWWDANVPCDASWTPVHLDLINLPDKIRSVLLDRGFTESHVLCPVSIYACGALGLRHGDWLDLFSGDNDLDDIEEKIAGYARYGVVPSEEALQELRSDEVSDWSGTMMAYFGYDRHLTDCSRALARV